MKIKNIVVTFWFEQFNRCKDIVDIFGKELTNYFPGFNFMSLPANVDPIIPRITAQSKSGHSIFNMSTINAQLTTNYDSNYNENFDSCLSYIEERAKKIYEILNTEGIKILYSAMFVNLEKEAEDPIGTIKNNLLSSEVNYTNVTEVGMRTARIIDNKYYQIMTINNSKEFTMQKQINPGETNSIIIPLISLNKAKVEKEYISVSYELNDKYSFDNNENYCNNSEIINEIFEKVKDDLNNNIERFIETGVIDN